VQNQKEEVLSLARKAAELEPQAPVPQVALSYAHQAAFDLENALDSLKQAVRLAPGDALIQARLAELELSRGELERALKVARRAVALDPKLARTQTVLGFALPHPDPDSASQERLRAGHHVRFRRPLAAAGARTG
jgi:tetratricopeptide (TPR) repeat protein